MTLYVATSNPAKLRDFAAADTLHIPIAPLPNLADITPPPEDDPTFEANAIAKARYYSNLVPAYGRHPFGAALFIRFRITE